METESKHECPAWCGKVMDGGIEPAKCERCRTGASGGGGPRLTLAPLVPEPPTETVSAMAAAIVRAYEEEHEWETMDATDVTVCARLNGSRAAL